MDGHRRVWLSARAASVVLLGGRLLLVAGCRLQVAQHSRAALQLPGARFVSAGGQQKWSLHFPLIDGRRTQSLRTTSGLPAREVCVAAVSLTAPQAGQVNWRLRCSRAQQVAADGPVSLCESALAASPRSLAAAGPPRSALSSEGRPSFRRLDDGQLLTSRPTGIDSGRYRHLSAAALV